MQTQTISKQTQNNWWLDTVLALSAVGAMLSGIYFLFLPVGGYQGGRNPYYGVQVLFDRHTWEDLHTWTGLAMIVVAAAHLVIHGSWVTSMARRLTNELLGKASQMNGRARFNLWLNIVVAASFFLTAISGVVFFFLPGGRASQAAGFIWSTTTWDLLHTWAGIILIGAAVVHFAIHWKWVTKVTAKMFAMLPQLGKRARPVSGSEQA
jgi:hypothetical protein